MNIIEAKKEIERTVRAYLRKDEYGYYCMDGLRQRPILLIGAPGIGKTAIVGQLAHEMGIGFVSYTITHHTRQSAIGLPYIQKKTYGGKEYSVTEFTMSEIIASVYDAIETQGKKEGILFIDEINCVSETLAPAMLELLQNKKFGPHKIPEGWILVSAGNPAEYNKSVRDFDVATLDRVRKIEVEPDFTVWKKYATDKMLCPSVLYYLSLNPECFFVIEKDVDGYKYVTARGWEDLSVTLTEYKNLGEEITLDFVKQFVKTDKIAAGFYRYYSIYEKYKTKYNLEEVLKGGVKYSAKDFENSTFDERFAIVEIFVSMLTSIAKNVMITHTVIDKIDSFYQNKDNEQYLKTISNGIENGTLGVRDKEVYKILLSQKDKTISEVKSGLEDKILSLKGEFNYSVENAFAFVENCFSVGQEMTALLINLISDVDFISCVADCGCEIFYKYNELLLVDEKSETLKRQAAELLKQNADK